MKKFAFVFPGQGSQALKMMDHLLQYKVVQDRFTEAQAITGVDYLAMLQDETDQRINQTVNTQPLMLIADIAYYDLWIRTTKAIPDLVFGHSLGEFAALVVSGVISFADALRIVVLRAKYMQEAVPIGVGAMAAALGASEEQVTLACNNASAKTGLVVAGVNYNAPGQIVIAGHTDAVNQAAEELKIMGVRKVQLLAVSIPSHSILMKPAADRLAVDLNMVQFNVPKIAVIQNVNAQVVNNLDEIKFNLVQQLYSPVQWVRSVQTALSMGIVDLVECGPKKILSANNKRIDESVVVHKFENIDEINSLYSILAN